MRWHLWATVVAAYAAELRLETFVTVELTLDSLPLTLRAHVDDDPEKTAEMFCKDAIPLSLECKCQERLNIWAAVEQAQANCPAGATPCVVFTRNRAPTHAVVPWETLLGLYRDRTLGTPDQLPPRLAALLTELAAYAPSTNETASAERE